MVKPKKHLGQHFLVEEHYAESIAALAVDVNIGFMLEIGPGKGVLTQYLLSNFKNKLETIELDKESVDYLNNHFNNNDFVNTYGDFLKYPIPNIKNTGIIGNFPYNISSQIAFKVLENMDNISFFAGMFQKEVAERLSTPYGSKKYGVLSVLLQAFYEVEYCFSVPNTAFYPPPKVESGVIKAVKRTNPLALTSYKTLKTVVKSAFNNRRKMLSNSLKGLQITDFNNTKYAKLRPEQMSVKDFCALAKLYKDDKNARK